MNAWRSEASLHFFCPPCGSQRLNSGCPAWEQALLPTEPSCLPRVSIFHVHIVIQSYPTPTASGFCHCRPSTTTTTPVSEVVFLEWFYHNSPSKMLSPPCLTCACNPSYLVTAAMGVEANEQIACRAVCMCVILRRQGMRRD